MTVERIQKILARAGFGSRRSAETLITEGRVTVNGVTVTELGAKADPLVDSLTVDGKPVETGAASVCVALHKPAGAVSTVHDTHGRMTVMSLLPRDLPPGVVPIGRLDRDTAGLLLLTNDGELAHRVAHPSYHLEKEYLALVAGLPSAASLEALRSGVDIGGHITAPATVSTASPPPGYFARDGHTWLRIVIHEGRKRQVRLMCASIKHDVRLLIRMRVGPIELGDLPLMKARRLTQEEVSRLRASVSLVR